MKRLSSGPTLAAKAHESLRKAIINGELVPGRLYSMSALASHFNVSRTPVREALLLLSDQGMVRMERNQGIRILQTTVHDLEEVFALRLLLEVPATFRATRQMTPTTLSKLRQQYRGMDRAAGNSDESRAMECDRHFHRIILDCSGNRRLASFVDTLRDVALTYGASTAGKSRTLRDIVAEHQPLLNCIEAGDAPAAAAIMRKHIVRTAELLVAQQVDGLRQNGLLDFGWISAASNANESVVGRGWNPDGAT